jgi:hypothetical protein
MPIPIIGFDIKSNLNCKQFSQCTGDTLYLGGHTIICGIGTIDSNNGYSVCGQKVFSAGNNSCTSIQIGKDAVSNGTFSTVVGYNSSTTGNTSIVVGINSYAQHDCSLVIGNNNNRSCSVGGNIIGGSSNCLGSQHSGSTMLGMNNCNLSSGSYVCYVIIPNLAILNAPSGSGGILCYDNATKKVCQTSALTISGTANYIPKFCSGGTNITNSNFSIGQVCYSGIGLYPALQTNDGSNRINFGFCNDVYKGVTLSYSSGSNSGPVLSPISTGSLHLQSNGGSFPTIMTSCCLKINVTSSANNNIVIAGTTLYGRELYAVCGDDYGSTSNGNGVGLIGGNARPGFNLCGGDVLLRPGLKDGSGSNGNVFIQILPAKTIETNILYIDSTGKISSGATPTVTGGTSIGWSNLLNGSTVAGCGTVTSGSTICNNTFYGVNAGKNITSGTYNTGIGTFALSANTIGYQNTAIGSCALHKNIDGYNNVAVGKDAMDANTSGFHTVAIGSCALRNNTTAFYNVGIGPYALMEATTGNRNTAIGVFALQNNVLGCSNTGLGDSAIYGANNHSGCLNTGVGFEALRYNYCGHRNVAIGMDSMNQNSCGSENTAIGPNSLYSNLTGNYNVAVGRYAGYGKDDSNKLYVANTFSCSLIYGEFDNKRLVISGTTEIVNNAGCNYLYLGNKDTDGSWRFVVSGASPTCLVVQTRTGGVWGGNKQVAP